MIHKEKLSLLKDNETNLIKAKYLRTLRSCPIDGSDSYTLLFRKDGLNFVRCDKCNLIFINPQLNEKALDLIYSDLELSTTFVEGVLESKVQRDFDYRKFESTLEEITNIISKKVISVLDIGCGSGLFLKICSEKGFICQGVEISPHSKVCKREIFS